MIQIWSIGLSDQKRWLQVVGRPVLVQGHTICPPTLWLALLLCHCRGHHDVSRNAHDQKRIFPYLFRASGLFSGLTLLSCTNIFPHVSIFFEMINHHVPIFFVKNV